MMSVDPWTGMAGAAIPVPVQLASGWAVRWLGMCGGGAIGAPPAAQGPSHGRAGEVGYYMLAETYCATIVCGCVCATAHKWLGLRSKVGTRCRNPGFPPLGFK